MIIVDATHTKARYHQKSPKEFLQEKSKQVRRAVYQVEEEMVGKFPSKPTTNEVEDELNYSRQVIDVMETQSKVAQIPAVKEKVNVLKEVIEDFELQMSYSNDLDARTGHKSADTSFFGYKTHIAMSDERIITAAIVTTGKKSDDHYLQPLIEKSKATGMEIETVIGDTAYSGKENLAYTKSEELQLISKLHPVITNGSGQRQVEFDYNKDAGMFVCPAGLFGTEIQGATTIFVVNLKRILKLLSQKE